MYINYYCNIFFFYNSNYIHWFKKVNIFNAYYIKMIVIPRYIIVSRFIIYSIYTV